MDRNARTGILAAALFVALLFALPDIHAASVAICNSPVYEGLCCEQYATPVRFPSGNGCCYAGQPYPGDTCPAIFSATPTPTPSAAPGTTLITDMMNHRVIEVDTNKNIVWQYGTTGVRGNQANQLAQPGDAKRLPNGNTLIADIHNHRVIEVDTNKNIVWQYGTGVQASGFNQVNNPIAASRLPNGNTLIASGYYRVFEVDTNKNVVWEYGGTQGTGPNQLYTPYDAQRLQNGNTLIADTSGNRVIEVDTNKNIIWQYGTANEGGSGFNQVYRPYRANRLLNGNTLIADTSSFRVIEVNPGKTIVWQYGTTNVSGTGTNQLKQPVSVQRQENGNTLISDMSGQRVIEVDSNKNVVWQYGDTTAGSNSNQVNLPFMAFRIPPSTASPAPSVSPTACIPEQVIRNFDGHGEGQTQSIGVRTITGPGASVTATVAAGKAGRGLEFKDTNAAPNIGAYALIQRAIEAAPEGSISFDIQPKQGNANFTFVLQGKTGSFLDIYLFSDGTFRYVDSKQTSGDPFVRIGKKTYQANQWYRIGVNWTQGGFDFFVDGVKQNAARLPHTYPQDVGPALAFVLFTGVNDLAADAGTFWVDNLNFPTCKPHLSSAFVTQTPPPSTMAPGQKASVSVTFRNTGFANWTGEGAYDLFRLGYAKDGVPVLAADPSSQTWGSHRQLMGAGELIQKEATKTFSFEVTAPATLGTYPFQWQMVEEQIQWFGPATPQIQITVATPTPTPTPLPSGVTPTPPPEATPSQPVPNMVLSMVCPKSVLVSPTETDITAFAVSSDGRTLCPGRLDVTFPDKTTQGYGFLDCVNGNARFLVPIPSRGQYSANATFGTQTVTCGFSAVGSAPRPVDETNLLVVALLAFAAFCVVGRRR